MNQVTPETWSMLQLLPASSGYQLMLATLLPCGKYIDRVHLHSSFWVAAVVSVCEQTCQNCLGGRSNDFAEQVEQQKTEDSQPNQDYHQPEATVPLPLHTFGLKETGHEAHALLSAVTVPMPLCGFPLRDAPHQGGLVSHPSKSLPPTLSWSGSVRSSMVTLRSAPTGAPVLLYCWLLLSLACRTEEDKKVPDLRWEQMPTRLKPTND